MIFWNILKNDIARGIFKRRYLYIISSAVMVALVIIADMSLTKKINTYGYNGGVSAGDLYQIFYKGSRIIKPENVTEIYISEQYLFMILSIAFIVGNYYVKDFSSVGMQIIVRCGSIKKWFISKIMWCAASVIYITTLVDIMIALVSLIHGYELGMNVHMELLSKYGYASKITGVATGDIIFMSIVLPILSLFTVAFVQMLLSMICSPTIALMAVSAGMIATIFSGNALLVFNGLMCVRNNVYMVDGTYSIHMLIADIVIILISGIAGYVYVSRVDILNPKEL